MLKAVERSGHRGSRTEEAKNACYAPGLAVAPGDDVDAGDIDGAGWTAAVRGFIVGVGDTDGAGLGYVSPRRRGYRPQEGQPLRP